LGDSDGTIQVDRRSVGKFKGSDGIEFSGFQNTKSEPEQAGPGRFELIFGSVMNTFCKN